MDERELKEEEEQEQEEELIGWLIGTIYQPVWGYFMPRG